MSSTDSFEAMLVAHLPRLKGFAMMLARNRSIADDLLQETACRALRKRHQFVPGTSFSAWTFCILRNEYISTLRRAKRVVCIDDLAVDLAGKRGDQEDIVLTNEVLRAMATLRTTEQEVLTLVAAAGLTYDEAAEHLAVSVGTVKSRLWRARKNLAAILLPRDASTVPGLKILKNDGPRLLVLTEGLT
jgi:RNA polymerase sigma-70 factor (ECF subfamily)